MCYAIERATVQTETPNTQILAMCGPYARFRIRPSDLRRSRL